MTEQQQQQQQQQEQEDKTYFYGCGCVRYGIVGYLSDLVLLRALGLGLWGGDWYHSAI